MSDTRATIEIGGSDVSEEVLRAGARIEVEEAIGEPDAATISVAITPTAEGEWPSIIDDLATPSAELRVTVEHDDVVYTFAGLAIGATWTIAPAGYSEVVCRALDHTVEMDRVERTVAWPGSADSAIASSIFGSYGFAADVETTPAGPDPDVCTPIQRATDWAYLRSLAGRWGYATFLEVAGDKVTGHFRPIDPTASPSATLRFGFGDEAISGVEVEVDFDGGGAVVAARIPPLADGSVSAEATGDDQAAGDEPIAAARRTLLGPADVDGVIEPFDAATGRAREQAFGVRLTATTDPIALGPMVRARRTVEVHGLGSRLSGLYLVERVRHTVSEDHHEQRVVLVRNALGSSAGSLLGGLV